MKFVPLHISPFTTTVVYLCNLYGYATNLPSMIIKFVQINLLVEIKYNSNNCYSLTNENKHKYIRADILKWQEVHWGSFCLEESLDTFNKLLL